MSLQFFKHFPFCMCVFYISVKSHLPQAIGTKLSGDSSVLRERKLQKKKLMATAISAGFTPPDSARPVIAM